MKPRSEPSQKLDVSGIPYWLPAGKGFRSEFQPHDGQKAGEIRFPGGEVDLTSVCRPGGQHVLSILVVALPLKGVLLSYTDSASAREVKGSVARRGLA